MLQIYKRLQQTAIVSSEEIEENCLKGNNIIEKDFKKKERLLIKRILMITGQFLRFQRDYTQMTYQTKCRVFWLQIRLGLLLIMVNKAGSTYFRVKVLSIRTVENYLFLVVEMSDLSHKLTKIL